MNWGWEKRVSLFLLPDLKKKNPTVILLTAKAENHYMRILFKEVSLGQQAWATSWR